MSIQQVKQYLDQWQRGQDVQEFTVSSATVALAAEALGVAPARIAKSLSFRKDDACVLVVTAGDTKIDNSKFKAQFSCKAKMLTADEVLAFTGHTVGGVCPFALPATGVMVYCDQSLQRFDTVFPACGTNNSAIEVTPDQLFLYGGAIAWVDVCKW